MPDSVARPTHALLCVIAREQIDADPDVSYDDWVERVKWRVAQLRLDVPYSDRIYRAIDAVAYARRAREHRGE
jgi:hypothetical protein